MTVRISYLKINTIYCDQCDAEARIPVPIDLDSFIDFGKAWEKAHNLARAEGTEHHAPNV